MGTNNRYFGETTIDQRSGATLDQRSGATLDQRSGATLDNTRVAILQQIETMRILSTNVDEWRGFLRGKVIEHWAAYERDGKADDLWRARIYREKLQENLPK